MDSSPNADKLLFLLKTKGPQTAQVLGNILGITSMGARQHLQTLAQQGLIASFDDTISVGRPKRFWKLTEKAQQLFPDTHAYLTVELIKSIQNLFGEHGMEQVIASRERDMLAKYQQALADCRGLEDKVRKLAELRTAEGYMAEYQHSADDSYLLVENHCPICAAASQCLRFCQSELQLFQQVLGEEIAVKRLSHIISGAQRCSYQISLKPS